MTCARTCNYITVRGLEHLKNIAQGSRFVFKAMSKDCMVQFFKKMTLSPLESSLRFSQKNKLLSSGDNVILLKIWTIYSVLRPVLEDNICDPCGILFFNVPDPWQLVTCTCQHPATTLAMMQQNSDFAWNYKPFTSVDNGITLDSHIHFKYEKNLIFQVFEGFIIYPQAWSGDGRRGGVMEALLVRFLGGFLRWTCAMYGPGMDANAMEALLVRFCVDCIMRFFLRCTSAIYDPWWTPWRRY